jgi:hypothetical protein
MSLTSSVHVRLVSFSQQIPCHGPRIGEKVLSPFSFFFGGRSHGPLLFDGSFVTIPEVDRKFCLVIYFWLLSSSGSSLNQCMNMIESLLGLKYSCLKSCNLRLSFNNLVMPIWIYLSSHLLLLMIFIILLFSL